MIDKHDDCCGGDCGNNCGDDGCKCHAEKTEKHCPCSVCDGQENLEELAKREAEMMDKQGWVAHCVSCDDDQTPMGFNYHTHGFEKSFGCPDIQFVLPIDPKIVHGLTHNLAESIKKEGLKITDGMFYDKLIKGFSVKFVAATECDRTVLRIILPDKHGCLTADAEGPFGEQYKDL